MRDVAKDLGGADDFALLVFYRGNRQRDIDGLSAFRDPDSLKVLDATASPYLFEDHLLIGMKVFWDEFQDGLPDHLFGSIPEDARRGCVPACHNAIQIFADDHLVGGLNDCR